MLVQAGKDEEIVYADIGEWLAMDDCVSQF